MRVLAAALLALVFAGTAVLSASAATEAQLEQAILSRDDLGRGYSIFQEGPNDQLAAAGVPSYLAVFQRGPIFPDLSFDLVIAVLADEAGLGTVSESTDIDAAIGAVTGLGFELREAEAPAIGSDTRRFLISGAVAGFPLSGELIVWRQSGVVATVGMIGSRGGSAESLARRQSAKLDAVFGY